MDWFLLGLISSLFFGIQKFLFKVAVENKCSTQPLTLSFMITVSLLGFIMFLLNGISFPNLQIMAIFAICNGIFFLLLSIFRYESLKYIPGTVAFPLMELTSVIVIIFSIIFLHESLTIYQFMGILLGLVVSYLLLQRHQDEKAKYNQFRKGLIFVFIAIIAAATTQIIAKFIADTDINLLLYIAISYLFNSTLLLLYQLIAERKAFDGNTLNKNKSLYYGVAIGVTNFIAFYAYLKALEPGSLALITILVTLATILPVMLSLLIYKEKITVRRGIAIVLAIVALVLIR